MRIDSFLQQSPAFQAGRIARHMESSLNAALRQEGLTFSESLMLAAIFLEKTSVRPSDLARSFETTRGNVSHCISSLEAKGLVSRRIDPDDARAFRLVLQAAGRRRAVRIVGILDRMQAHFEANVGVAKLRAMLEQMEAVEKLCAHLERTQERS